MKRAFIFVALFSLCSPAFGELRADQILLVTNKNVPASAELATLYAQLRHIPPGQTIALDLPNDEEMDFKTYETAVVAPLRQYLSDHHLTDQITCLLTFYGVPFRIRDRVNTPDENSELQSLQAKLNDLLPRADSAVSDLEKFAMSNNSAFHPKTGADIDALQARASDAIHVEGDDINTTMDAQVRQMKLGQFNRLLLKIGGPLQLNAEENQPPEQHQKNLAARAEFDRLEKIRWDGDDRRKVRVLAEENFGLLGDAAVINAQIGYLTAAQSGAATDNELALLWWGTYPRARWLMNPFYFRVPNSQGHTVMVMRLDGPNPADVKRMMQDSVQVEQTGLDGTVAIDARGIALMDSSGKQDSYGIYDEMLRHFAQILQAHTSLKVVLDNRPEVFAPHTVHNVALYVGWYSVGKYVPGCDFVPGAIGYHIASFEMVKLHGDSPQWVHGLIGSGCAATLGPVAEPYLGAFPHPDEFFPLLLTGKLTLSEVYWRTTPMTSWMISMIGDPLYTPYKAHPAINVDDLPPDMRAAVTN